MMLMVILAAASAVAAYVAGRYFRDELLWLPLASLALVGLIAAPLVALGACGPRYRGKRLKALGLRCLVIAPALGSLLASLMVHRLGRVDVLKATFTREVIAAIRSSAAAALPAHPDEQYVRLCGTEVPTVLKAVAAEGYWSLDIQRREPDEPPLIRLWNGNRMFACGIVMVGLSADSRWETPTQPDRPGADEDTAYFPWLDGSLLFVGRDD